MGRTRNRFYSRGCGRNPAGLGLKWEEKKDTTLTPFGILSRHGRNFTLTVRIGDRQKRITVNKEVAEKLIAEYDEKREAEYNHNWEIEE